MSRARWWSLAMIACLGFGFSLLLAFDSLLVTTVADETIEDNRPTRTDSAAGQTIDGHDDATDIHRLNPQTNDQFQTVQQVSSNLTVVLVVCGDGDEMVEQTVTAMKSIALVTRSTFNIIVVTDAPTTEDRIRLQVNKWPKEAHSRFNLTFRAVWYPDGYEWMKKYRTLCTTERLYLPHILTEEDAVLYLDTDVILLDDAENLWNYFHKMNSSQLAALAPEHEVPENAFYNSPYNKIPYYGPLGLNAGVMLMNLTRMRNFPGGWINLIHKIYEKYKYSPLHFADQDILNIIFYMHPDKLLELPCRWNFRSDHCNGKGGNSCPSAAEEGVALVHGNRRVFHNARDFTFRAIYKAFYNRSWNTHDKEDFVDSITRDLKKEYNTACGLDLTIFVTHLHKSLLNSRNKII